MGNGRGKLDIPYLAIFSFILLGAVAASLYFFPEWRESPATMIVLLVAAIGGVVGLAANFRSAFIRDKADAPPAPLDYDSPQHRRNQENVTANVRSAWIDGVLRDSLPERVRLELALDSPPGKLQRTIVTLKGQEPRREPASAGDIADLFRASGRALLILGAPGSGKTVTLLELCRPVLEGAEADPRCPVPVVLNLSTWAQKQAPLAEWIADEMWRQYGLNRKVTPVWLAADHLILLLDGLDEVASDAREACVKAINAFREAHGAGLAICSRSADYADLRERLALSRAVEIQPLTAAQIEGYLNDERLELGGVRQAIARDDALRELATTPLMLNVMAVAYGGRPLVELLPLLENENERRAHLYDTYLSRMFRRKPLTGVSYTAAQALRWLRFLAARLTEREETQFFIEDMQPDWLPKERERSGRLVLGIVLGTLFGVMLGVLFGVLGGLLDSIVDLVVSSLIDDVLDGYVIGVADGVIDDIFFKIGSSVLFSVVIGVTYGMLLGMQDIKPVHELEIDFRPGTIWQLAKHRESVLILLLSGLASGMLGWGIFGTSEALDMVFFVMLGVIGGAVAVVGIEIYRNIRPLQRKSRDRLNNGIRRSAVISVSIGVVFGVLVGVLGGLLSALLFGFDMGKRIGGVYGVLYGLASGFQLGTFTTAMIGPYVVLYYGGQAVFSHILLRLLLARHRLLPLRLIPYLEAMRERILLQRAGGHYRFIHRTLQEHIAALTDERIAALAGPPENR